MISTRPKQNKNNTKKIQKIEPQKSIFARTADGEERSARGGAITTTSPMMQCTAHPRPPCKYDSVARRFGYRNTICALEPTGQTTQGHWQRDREVVQVVVVVVQVVVVVVVG